jgi:hypothetical protein
MIVYNILKKRICPASVIGYNILFGAWIRIGYNILKKRICPASGWHQHKPKAVEF